jgi:hypothetical protein
LRTRASIALDRFPILNVKIAESGRRSGTGDCLGGVNAPVGARATSLPEPVN